MQPRPDPAAASEHVCRPVYVTEGEVVCFDCGANYIFACHYDEEGLEECRRIVGLREEGFERV